MCSAKPIKKVARAVTKPIRKVSRAVTGTSKPSGGQIANTAGGPSGGAPLGNKNVNADDADLNIKKKKSKSQKQAGGNQAYKNTVAKTNAVNAAGSGSGVNVTGG